MSSFPEMVVLTVAGGNPTAIRILDQPHTRAWYARAGAALRHAATARLQACPGPLAALEAEQAGFLIPSIQHFEMSGGELCGNAVLSASLLQARRQAQRPFTLSTSGIEHPVTIAEVAPRGPDKAGLTVIFRDLPNTVEHTRVAGEELAVVDLGGIVHVILPGPGPTDHAAIRQEHTRLRAALGLEERAAVGVNWLVQQGDSARLLPVVWVRGDASDPSTSSFCFETACGSGSIAAALASGAHQIIQPTGKALEIDWSPHQTRVRAEVEIVLRTK